MRTEMPDETPQVDMYAMMDRIFLLIFFLVAATIRKKQRTAHHDPGYADHPGQHR